MAYRDDGQCHLCGAETHRSCPQCGRGVCADHAVSSWLEELVADGAGADERAAAERVTKRLGGTDACDTCLEQEILGTRSPAAVIYRSGDPMQAQMIAESLLEAGFDARLLGTRNAALLGVGQMLFEQRIEVPEAQAEAAAALVSSLVDERHRGG